MLWKKATSGHGISQLGIMVLSEKQMAGLSTLDSQRTKATPVKSNKESQTNGEWQTGSVVVILTMHLRGPWRATYVVKHYSKRYQHVSG